MKKYFAKFLPVPGEIKEGDFYKQVGQSYILQSTMSETVHGVPIAGMIMGRREHLSHTIESVPLQKLELFLLSHDIEVGDEVHSRIYWEKGIVGGFNESPERVFYFEGKKKTLKNFHHISNWGKVVGKIINQGVSISHGDEFEEEPFLKIERS